MTKSEYLKKHRAELKRDGKCRECRGKHGALVLGKSKCQHCLDKDAKRRRNKAEANPAFHMFWNRKRLAQVEGIPFTITMDDIVVPEFCPVLGIRLVPGCKVIHDASPTLDRIIPELGYVPGNIVVMSRRANRLKNNASLTELVALGRWAENVSGLRT